MSSASADLEPQPGAVRRRPATRVLTVVLVAIGVLAVWSVGRWLTSNGTELHLRGGFVLVGGVDPVLTARVLLPVGVALAGVLWGPALAHRVRWPALLAGSAAASGLWAVTLASTRGWDRLAEPMASKHEYLHDVGRVGDLGTFLATFVDSVPVDSADPWVTHVAGHPPGALLVFVLLDRLGLGGPGWAAAHCIIGGTLTVPAVLVTVRAVADETVARAIAPFAVLVPSVVWVATSADALFAGVTAWGVALLAVAAARGPSAGSVAAFAGGLVLGSSLFLSFGLGAAGLLALAVVLVHQARLGWAGVVRLLTVGALGVVVVFALFAVGGYWWFEGIVIDAQRVRDGAAWPDRPYAYFLVANVGAAAVAAGPAVVAGLAGLRREPLGWVPWAALGGMAVSNASGLVLGETERIWLPFIVWLLPATATLPPAERRIWLALSALLAIVVEVTVRTPW